MLARASWKAQGASAPPHLHRSPPGLWRVFKTEARHGGRSSSLCILLHHEVLMDIVSCGSAPSAKTLLSNASLARSNFTGSGINLNSLARFAPAAACLSTQTVWLLNLETVFGPAGSHPHFAASFCSSVALLSDDLQNSRRSSPQDPTRMPATGCVRSTGASLHLQNKHLAFSGFIISMASPASASSWWRSRPPLGRACSRGSHAPSLSSR